MMKKIDKWFENHRTELLSDISRLVAVKSPRGEPEKDRPFGKGPAEAVRTAAEIMYGYGLNVRNFGDIVVTGDISSAPPKLGILAHLDVVPEGEGWSSDPYKMELRDGKIYGRGVSDDKGPAMAALFAMRCVKELCPELKQGCRLILGSAEETGSEDIAYYKNIEAMPPMVFTPDGEFPVVNFEKGRYAPNFGDSWPEEDAAPRVVSFKGGVTANIVPHRAQAEIAGMTLDFVEHFCREFSKRTGAQITAEQGEGTVKVCAEGRAAHASAPGDGINAQTALIEMLANMPFAASKSYTALYNLHLLFPHGDWEGEALDVKMSDELSGELTVNFGVLQMDGRGFRANIDCRAPACATEENFVGPVNDAFSKCGFWLIGENKYEPPHHTPAESEFVRTLLKAYEDCTGNEGRCISIGGGSYVHSIEGGVAYGCCMPGVNTNMHGANEFMPVDDLILAAKIFTVAIIELCR